MNSDTGTGERSSSPSPSHKRTRHLRPFVPELPPQPPSIKLQGLILCNTFWDIPSTAKDIAEYCKVPITKCKEVLSYLEQQGFVEHTPTNQWVKTEKK